MKTGEGRWISIPERPGDAGTAERVRLFCLPHAGAGAAGYFRWRRLLPAWIEVCPVLLPGREMRLGEACAGSVSEVAQALSAAAEDVLQEPYAIFGHSMGALLAFELARHAEAAGGRVARRLFFSGRDAPGVSAAGGRMALHSLGDGDFIAALRARYGGLPAGFLEDDEVREVFLPILRADLKLVETYAPSTVAKLHCPVTALAGIDDTSVSAEGLAAWGDVTEGRFDAMLIAGDHFYHHGGGQAELLRLIEERLRRTQV